MYRKYLYTLVIAMLISTLALGAEVRKLTQEDVQWTSPTYPSVDCVVTSPGGHTGHPLDNTYKLSAPWTDVRAHMSAARLAAWQADNTIDITAEIQAAIDSLPAVVTTNDTDLPTSYNSRGGEVYFPPGTYRFTALTVKSFQGLRGAGKSSILKQIGTSGPAITVATGGVAYVYQVRISDLSIEGSATSAVSGNYGIYGVSILRSHIDHLSITGFGDSGIYFKGGSYTYIQNSYIFGNWGEGTTIVDDAGDYWATNCYILNNTFEVNKGPGIGIYSGLVGGVIAKNTVESNGLVGRKIGPAGHQSDNNYNINIYLQSTTYVTIKSNYLEQGGSDAGEDVQVAFSGGYYNNISENTFANETPIIFWAADAIGPADYNTVMNNLFSSGGGQVKLLYEAGSSRQTGNKFLYNVNLNLYEQYGSLSSQVVFSNNSDKLVNAYQSFSSGSSFTPNCGLNTTGVGSDTYGRPKGNVFVVTLNDNTTVNLPVDMADGEEITFMFIQDGTGGRTVSWNGQYKHAWSDTGNTANKTSTITFKRLGDNRYQIGAQSPWY